MREGMSILSNVPSESATEHGGNCVHTFEIAKGLDGSQLFYAKIDHKISYLYLGSIEINNFNIH